tara:strand:- start:10284 stop:10514 length:231 start_codon:yes stop_codon:yes gene_type:complete
MRFITDDWDHIKRKTGDGLTPKQMRLLEVYFLTGVGAALGQMGNAAKAGVPADQALEMLLAEHKTQFAMLQMAGAK